MIGSIFNSIGQFTITNGIGASKVISPRVICSMTDPVAAVITSRAPTLERSCWANKPELFRKSVPRNAVFCNAMNSRYSAPASELGYQSPLQGFFKHVLVKKTARNIHFRTNDEIARRINVQQGFLTG